MRCGPGCGPGICGVGRAAGQDMSKYAVRGGGVAPNDIVAGWVRAQHFQPVQFL